MFPLCLLQKKHLSLLVNLVNQDASTWIPQEVNQHHVLFAAFCHVWSHSMFAHCHLPQLPTTTVPERQNET